MCVFIFDIFLIFLFKLRVRWTGNEYGKKWEVKKKIRQIIRYDRRYQSHIWFLIFVLCQVRKGPLPLVIIYASFHGAGMSSRCRCNKRKKNRLNFMSFFFFFCCIAGGSQCGPPAVPLNGRATLTGSSSSGDQDRDQDANQLHNAGTLASYICDAGYELIG